MVSAVHAGLFSVDSIPQLQYSNANEFYVQDGFGFVAHITYDSEKMDADVYVKDLMRDARDH